MTYTIAENDIASAQDLADEISRAQEAEGDLQDAIDAEAAKAREEEGKLAQAIADGRFREDLFYRLNTVPITIPPLRERGDDVCLLFRKFASDFAQSYHMPPIQLAPDALDVLKNYTWPGNVRQLKNVTEQISIIERNREISSDILMRKC